MQFKSAILGVALLAFCAGAANATSGSNWLGINVGAGLPSGNFGDAASTGWNLGVTGTHMLNEQWGVGGDVGYHMWGASDALKASLAPGDKFNWSAIQATGHAMLRMPTSGNVKPYAQVGVGLYNLQGSLSSSSGDVSQSKSKFGYNIGAGADLMASGNMKWGVSGAYHMIPAKADFGSDVNEFSFGVNMQWGLGGK
jgi:opacity protein-like surface antigen